MNPDNNNSWERLKAELTSEIFFGPYINPNGLAGKFSINLDHTGLSLELAIPSAKIDVPILRHKNSIWWRKDQYLVPTEGIGFSFTYSWSNASLVDGFGLLSFFSLLGTILQHRKLKSAELFSLLSALEPILEQSGGAPLKTNALRTPITARPGIRLPMSCPNILNEGCEPEICLSPHAAIAPRRQISHEPIGRAARAKP